MGLVHWDDPEGWYEEGGGRGVQDWVHTERAASTEPLGCAGVLGKQARQREWRDGDRAGEEGREERDQRTKAVGCEFPMQESPGANR